MQTKRIYNVTFIDKTICNYIITDINAFAKLAPIQNFYLLTSIFHTDIEIVENKTYFLYHVIYNKKDSSDASEMYVVTDLLSHIFKLNELKDCIIQQCENLGKIRYIKSEQEIELELERLRIG